jgi:CelD/BcsL family acetyltransferase involved in cellulose biosynthesis
MTLTADFEKIDDIAALGQRWRALEAQCDACFFLRWVWMGSWLESCVAGRLPLPDLLVVQRDGEDAALALIGRSVERRRLGKVATLWLNQVGDAQADRPFIEYNGLLVHSAHAQEASRAAWNAIAGRRDWSALMLSGMASDSPLLTDVPALRRKTVRDISPAYYVDLAAVRSNGSDYLALLSSNTRSQIRRSLKDEGGAITIECAEDTATIDAWLAAMQSMNSGRHADNAWDLPLFQGFARAITLAGLEGGSVELLRFCCNDAPLGYLLNFVHAGRAMNYQSAFAEPTTAKSKPGLMCHAAAIDRYAAAGLGQYSLLAGKDRYKKSLSTGAEELYWWTLERFSPALEAEAMLRRLLRKKL